jgi:cytochrome c553
MTQETRKDFKAWATAIVYNVQQGSCFKCGKPLGKRFHKHHKNGDHSDNSVENLELLCASCHAGEAYKTHIEQKKQALGNVEALIDKAIKGEVSGAATEKAIEAIKLQLSLIEQCYPSELEELPPEIRTRNYLVGSGLLLKEYEKGIRKGVNMGVNIQIETLLPYILKSLQLEGLIKKLSEGTDNVKRKSEFG